MTYAPRRCARCGAVVPSLPELAETARRARLALDGMRLALPDALVRGTRQVAAGLACYSQTCIQTNPKEAA
jgi:hypothetical protein